MKRVGRWSGILPLTLLTIFSLGQGCPPSTGTTGGDTGSTGTTGGDTGTTTDNKGIPAENSRVAFQSQCAQNVIACTVEYPRAHISVIAGTGQTVTPTAKGFLVQGTDHSGSEVVNLISNSTAGQGATQLFYFWSYGATDGNPLTLANGTQFSTQANTSTEMADGLHYIRLWLHNDIFENQILGTNGEVIATNTFLYDFQEVEIEVRD